MAHIREDTAIHEGMASRFRRRRFPAVLSGLFMPFLVAGWIPAEAQSLAGNRSRGHTPSISVMPETAVVAPGATVTFVATPHGGEAMLFSVKWRIREGRRGGKIEAEPAQRADGAYVATYTAPAAGKSPFHIDVRLAETGVAHATATVTLSSPR